MEHYYLIHFDIAAIVLILAIFSVFYMKKFFSIKTNRAFLLLGGTIMFSSAIDIITSVTIMFSEYVPNWLNSLLMILYFLSTYMNGFFTFNYLLKTADEKDYKRVKVVRVAASVVTTIYYLLVISSPWTHVFFYFTPEHYYYRGFLAPLNYAMIVMIILVALGIAASLGHIYDGKQKYVIGVGVPFLIAGTVVQYFNETFLVGNFAFAIFWFMLFEIHQNPAEFVDQKLKIFNAKAFYYMLDAKLKKNKNMAVLVFELEGFQFVDQVMGVENGDKLLKIVADECAASRKDQLYHLEGTQFAYIFDSANNDVNACAEWLKWRFLSVFRVNHVEVSLLARISAVRVPDVAKDKEEIMNSIGYSLELAKKNNIFGVVWATKEGIDDFKRQTMVGFILKRAILNREFEVYYQPIYSTKTNEFCTAEALVRLRDEELGYISPEEFVPIAEKNGLILEIGDIVFEKVCEFIASGEVSRRGIKYIEVNLSVVQCLQEAMHKHLVEIMDKYEIPYNMVDFEITETFDISDNTVLINNMNRLIDLGCTFAMDDYGTGFSNANYLMEYPFKLIKLDKMFIWSAMENEKAMRILSHTVAMIKSLELKIVAEGVETKEQADILMELGCDYLQGYYFSPPINQNKYLNFMDNDARKFMEQFEDWDEKRKEKKSHVVDMTEGRISRANALAAKLSVEAK